MNAEAIGNLQAELCQFVLHTQTRLAQVRQRLWEGRNAIQATQLAHGPFSEAAAKRELAGVVVGHAQGGETCRQADAPTATSPTLQACTLQRQTEPTSCSDAMSLDSDTLERLAAVKRRLAEQIKSI